MAKRINRKRNLTPAQARYVLQKMFEDRRVTSADIDRYMRRMRNEIEELERRLTSLRPSQASRGARSPAPTGGRPARRRRTTSSRALLASRQLQAEYIRAIKTFPARARKKYSEITKSQGREAALAAMKKDMRVAATKGRARKRKPRSKK